jgi:uncharacterized membrane protein (DUF485 family)
MPKPVESQQTIWDRVAESEDFKDLMAAKARFIVPATLFFVIYYFLLPVLVGYAPQVMSRPVIGPVNLAYLFALSQFFVAWGLAALYTRKAAQFDRVAKRIVDRVEAEKESAR